MGQMQKIAITVDKQTLSRLDSLVRRRKSSRSSLIRQALERAMTEEIEREMARKIDEVYSQSETAEESRRIAEQMLASSPLSLEREGW